MKKLLLLLLLIPSLTFANTTDKLKTDLAKQGIILLDILSNGHYVTIDGEKDFAVNIAFALDRGYSYSTGPLRGTVYLKPHSDGYGGLHWELVYDFPEGYDHHIVN